MKITIIGGGTSGHITALFFAKKTKHNITWIYPLDNNPIGVGESIVPYVQNFLNTLGISISDILEFGNLKLGILFKDFFDDDRYHPFGNSLEESIMIMEFMKNKPPKNILEYEDIATQFDVTQLYPLILNKLKDTNINIIRRKYIESDFGELTIDCTGFNRLIKPDQELYIRDDLTNDTALVYKVNNNVDNNIDPYSTFYKNKIKHSWTWKIPLKYSTGYGFVFSSKHQTIESATLEFKTFLKLDESYVSDIKKITILNVRNKKHFYYKNDKLITSIGLSSSFIEPLESTGLYLTCKSLELLKDVLDKNLTQDKYSNILNDEYDHITDFILSHFEKGYSYKESDLFPERSWKYISDPEYSKKVVKVNSQNIKILKEIRQK